MLRLRRLDRERKGVRHMPHIENGRVMPCEWHPDYDDDDCPECERAFDAWQERLMDIYLEMRHSNSEQK